MITARLPEPPRCRFPCARCGEPPSRNLPKKTRREDARCERCDRYEWAARRANICARLATEEFELERVNGTEDDPARIVRKMLKPLNSRLGAAESALQAAELARDPVDAAAWFKFAAAQFKRGGELHAELVPFMEEAKPVLEVQRVRRGLILVKGGAA